VNGRGESGRRPSSKLSGRTVSPEVKPPIAAMQIHVDTLIVQKKWKALEGSEYTDDAAE
jgi:hypothetical protein